MRLPLSDIKILKKAFSTIILDDKLFTYLESGDLLSFESLLHKKLMLVYDLICKLTLVYLSQRSSFIHAQKSLADSLGLKKLESRPIEIQLRTGTKVRFDSLYAKVRPKSYEDSRHLSLVYFKIEAKATPLFQSLTTLFSVICPSFEVAKSLLNYQGISVNFNRLRTVALSMASKCIDNRVELQLMPCENVVKQRVIIGIDGGRTRTRTYSTELNERDNPKFETPWREPKMLVISVIDKKGKQVKNRLPIYDSTFGDDETFDLLEEYLKALKIEQAESVQIIADGAPWIWNRAKPLLVKLGVPQSKIIETLDYYHAAEHLHKLKDYLPKEGKNTVFKKMKEQLWNGNISELGKTIKRAIPDVVLEDFKPFVYFEKNKHRIDYQLLRKENRPCGSGIIESGIRRIINLRFKAPSSFWYPDNVEKLILMRSIALAGRWEIMMKNLYENKEY